MKRLFIALAASAAMAALAGPATAADRGYDNGPVWDCGAIRTKPGHFDEYMKYVSTTWRASQEELKKKGYATDYRVFAVSNPRDNEPDLYLCTEYKNMAALDMPLDEQDAMNAKIFGSLTASEKAMAGRGDMRELRGSTLMRELILTKK